MAVLFPRVNENGQITGHLSPAQKETIKSVFFKLKLQLFISCRTNNLIASQTHLQALNELLEKADEISVDAPSDSLNQSW